MKNPNAQNQKTNSAPSTPPSNPNPRPSFFSVIPGWVVGLVVAVIFVALLASVSKSFWYFEVIENDQVGITIEAGEIQSVLQPGIAYDFGLFVDLVKITTSAVAITVDDPELITIDKQRIGLEVTADVFRPREADIVISNYSRYRNIYLNDESLQQRMTAFTLQAMKVCVGDKKFDEAVIGSGRDDLRACIDDELSGLAEPLGLEVRNVAVPQITISPEVQAGLDAIVQSRLATEKAKQDAEKAKQEAIAQQAVEEGRIRVDQAKLQEEARQQAILQDIKRQQLEAELAVIEQEQINAQAKLELTDLLQQVADEQALVDIAKELALAALYEKYPSFVTLQIALANASAIKPTDKFIFTQEGVFPNLIFSNGTLPTFNVNP
ncbi:MAG TPA: SPFH domain-containing protein [Anaerolineales bacterium]|nr:SPFH domain-containing protein [Anaerolineales bacterium]HMV96683.1 SPFH domain-containing protein [Anaerolineales bacterium]HMX20516.1 SPFH domain-containing protein [Anaerolineales bacterium]HMX75169.1 SPFH domain-containing protein [Anaerolineales bacterium]HMZ44254.1 SPFH domain-containing protein [Anaerolineales bacterium]